MKKYSANSHYLWQKEYALLGLYDDLCQNQGLKCSEHKEMFVYFGLDDSRFSDHPIKPQ